MSVYSDVESGLRKGALVALSEFYTTESQKDNLVIFSNDNGTEPSSPYVVVNILSITPQGMQSTSTQVDGQNQLALTAFYEVFVQYSFIGTTSGDMAQTFSQRLGYNPLVIEEYRRNKLGYLRKSAIRRAPQKRDTQWVEYHNMDAYFSYSVITEQVVDIIEKVILQDVASGEVFTVPPTITTIP